MVRESAAHQELKKVTLEHSPPDPVEKPLVISDEPSVQDVDRYKHTHRACSLVEFIAGILKTRSRLKLVMSLQA